MWKRAVALLIVFALAFSFAACKTDNEKTQTDQTEEASQKQGSQEEVKPQEPVEVYILTKVEAGTELPDDEKVQNFIVEQTGVRPVMIKPPAGTYEEKLNIMLASDDKLDAFLALNTWTDYRKKGVIMPINDILESEGKDVKRNYTKAEWDFVSDLSTGETYAIPFSSTPIGNAPRVRTDWLEKVGLKMPANLDEFEQVLEAFKSSDKLGNNVIPLVTHMSYQQMDRAFMGLWTENGDHNWIDSDGTVKPAILNPAYKDYIAKIAEWYKKGYIWREAFTLEFTVINDLVAQNRVGVLASWVSVGIGSIEALMKEDPGVEYKYMDKFEGPAGSAYSLRLPSAQGVVFSKKSENPEAAMKFFNWGIQNRTNRNIIDFGLEDVHWKWVDEGKGIIEKMEGSETKYSGIYSLVQGSTALGSSDASIRGQLWDEFFKFTTNPELDLKLPGDYGVFYDEAKINESVPSVGDIDKFRDQWLVKFIIGQEPLSKWDKFIEDLNKMGLDKMVEERNRQYKAAKN